MSLAKSTLSKTSENPDCVMHSKGLFSRCFRPGTSRISGLTWDSLAATCAKLAYSATAERNPRAAQPVRIPKAFATVSKLFGA